MTLPLFTKATLTAIAVAFSSAVFAPVATADTIEPRIKDRRIGYAMTRRAWAVHRTPGFKIECPTGLNDGPREQFAQLFPQDKGQKWTLVETQLAREADIYFPGRNEDGFVFKDAQGKVAPGLNLDNKVDANDFTNAEGTKGVDNQLFRALGCLAGWNGDGIPFINFQDTTYLRRHISNRYMFEISEVDDLTNDPEVIVTTYRGLDPLLSDSTGEGFIPGGTQRVDERFGKIYQTRLKGKIVDGVLITEPADGLIPNSIAFDTSAHQLLRGMQFHLKLTPERATGVIGGYADIYSWMLQFKTSWGTHHAAYGQVASQSLTRAMYRLADGYPDETGQNTALSAALDGDWVQVYIQHPPKSVAVNETAPGAAASAAER
ncbi:MAG: hypothetical protein AB7E79_04695 [Rhodospirillaceae bacterium]